MTRKGLIISSIILILAVLAVMLFMGDTYIFRTHTATSGSAEDITVIFDPEGIVRVEGVEIRDGILRIKLRSENSGKTFITVTGPEGVLIYDSLYVHPTGMITRDSYMGDFTGGIMIPVITAVFFACLLSWIIRRYRSGIRESMYIYRNIRDLGLIIFMSFLLFNQIVEAVTYTSPDNTVSGILGFARIFLFLSLPIVLLVSLFVTASNINLMRKEGRTWRNMLGAILGILFMLGAIFPTALGEFLQRSQSTLVDVHNMNGPWLYIEMFVEGFGAFIVAYLECILIATVIIAIKAAKHIPSFDKDYILILGCQIRKDGTLTPLLKGRADRALEFAAMQKEAAGKDLKFVPSGGKGSDEVMSEGDAIRNYLLKQGIPDERIIPETESKNTYENFRNSLELIRKDSGTEDPKIAFSTTNYHVFRSGLLAHNQGIEAEGIGSRTKSYFWINAFIREFVGTLYSERKTHVITAAVLCLLSAALTAVMYCAYTF
ncbi:MAG: YdcF family protein [Oscillospiraceae bacterium]|nr:YdcF family protein [Oscillospiraceae bacterium]